MVALAKVTTHLTLEELEDRFRRCRHPVEKIHFQVILLRAQGRSTSEVAKICGYKPDWVRRLVRRYNAYGPAGLKDGHRHGGGRKRFLSDQQLDELRRAVLESTPPGGGLWSGPKVARWMSEKLGRKIMPQRGWDYLRRLGMTKKVPRPRHPRASAAAQDEFKKNSGGVWQ